MAASLAKKKTRRSKKEETEELSFYDSVLVKFLSRVPAALLLLFLIFLWSSSTTIISGSIVHVCVTSRKLNNLYCLSAGAQPSNYAIPIPIISNSSENSVTDEKNQVPSAKSNPGSVPVGLNSFHPKNSVISEKNQVPSPKSNPDFTQTNPVPVGSSLLNPGSNHTNPGHHDSNPPTPALVMKESTDIELPSISQGSEVKVSEGINTKGTDNNANEEKSSVSDSHSDSSSSFAHLIVKRGTDRAEEEVVYFRKYVDEQLQDLRSYKAKSTPDRSCEGKGIYVYDLPAKFNKDLIGKCNDMLTWLDFCNFLSNNGMGKSIPELGTSWYDTHQYSLELIYHAHVLNHPCRVHNIEDARLFYVPFYGGLDILRWHFRTVPNDVKDQLSLELVKWLEGQQAWKRHFGLDHVFVLGKISWDFRRSGNSSWGSRLLELDEMQNPMKLLIERQPWHDTDVGVPHPTLFHPKTDQEIATWQEKIANAHRKNLVSFAGASRQSSKSIRSTLIDQCTAANHSCNFFDCSGIVCVHPAPLVKLFTESEFCLQPPGDSPTRKSVFDSLVTGCIPVLFDPLTAYYQYPWHLPEDHRKYSVFIDQEEVRTSHVNVIERLMKIPLNERQEMRMYIIYELMPKLVYADPNAKLEKFQDAFSTGIDSLFEWTARRLP